ncbi:hypothetical protein [Sphaerisporangium sp. TRM90804]|uniref:hypothetical protein n=1 Tax=Sphaerisporangium sp. TRM90804 TaxID=3031113 RepID=UPI0024482979|nr:hypothetical protein [Sphaerisporangium sp. TRM90804]MDH2427500.1 hypothetical protein [Sphaerisporangium sp. TRM90804]
MSADLLGMHEAGSRAGTGPAVPATDAAHRPRPSRRNPAPREAVPGRDGTAAGKAVTGGTGTGEVGAGRAESDTAPVAEQRALAAFAARRDLVYLPSLIAADLTLERLRAGQAVIVRGMGPGFTRLLAPLTVGRGGRFTRDRDGEPVYHPSGREPLLYVGSRRGVPPHAQAGYGFRGQTGPPRFLTEAELAGPPGDFRRDLWPAVAKELGYAYYRELLTAHPSRTRMRWPDFEDAYAAEPWGGKEMRALIRKAAPKPSDRLDLDRLDRPLRGMRFGDSAGLQRWMHGYMAAGLRRRTDPAHSADLAMAEALVALHAVLPPDPWFDGLVSLVADGPPAPRLAELRAVARAGVLTFLGESPRVEADQPSGAWRASGASAPGTVLARALIETPIPAPGRSRLAGARFRAAA